MEKECNVHFKIHHCMPQEWLELKNDITLPTYIQLIADGVADVSELRSEFGVIGLIPGKTLENGVIDFRNSDMGLQVRLLYLSPEDILLKYNL